MGNHRYWQIFQPCLKTVKQIIIVTLSLLYVGWVCLCVCVCTHACEHTILCICGGKRASGEGWFYHVDSRNQTQIIWFGGKCHYHWATLPAPISKLTAYETLEQIGGVYTLFNCVEKPFKIRSTWPRPHAVVASNIWCIETSVLILECPAFGQRTQFLLYFSQYQYILFDTWTVKIPRENLSKSLVRIYTEETQIILCQNFSISCG